MEEVGGDLYIFICVWSYVFILNVRLKFHMTELQGDCLIYETWNAQYILMILAPVLWENQKIFLCFYFKCASEISYDWITRRLLDLWNMKCSKYFNDFGPCVMREPENLSLFLFWCPLALFVCVVCHECGYHIEGWFKYEIINFLTKKPDVSMYG